MRRHVAPLTVAGLLTIAGLVAADSSTPPPQTAACPANILKKYGEEGCDIYVQETPPFVEKLRSLWRSLPASTNGCPADFDYFPDGGMRNFHCHLLPQIGFNAFEKLLGFPIFLSGPHGRNGRLDLKSTRSFGHYNPRFTKGWLPGLIPTLHDEKFRAVAQPIYDAKIRPLAQVHYRVYRKLQSDPEFLRREKARLLKEMASPRGATDTYERFYDYGSDAGEGNVSKTVVAFWIRRSIDGTDRDFFKALQRLLEVHDPTVIMQ